VDRFAGKVALVTGATRGIGAAIGRRLASEGAQVALCGRTVADGEALAADLGGAGRAIFVAADLTRPEDCARAVDATVAAFGRLDVLVNNAAWTARGTVETTTVEEFDRMMALNLRAPFLLVQRALPTFKRQHAEQGAGGVIVNIASINAYVGLPNLIAYSASKGGLVTLSKNLADGLSPWLVRTHVLNVGWTLTEGEVLVQAAEGAPADWAEEGGKTRPWGRLIKSEEIAAVATFLASDEAAVFSGTAIDLEQFPLARLSAGHVGK
jgi:NAD(P)-dependent dehydrogenase (short-subunit alcohol dehydrogenase family)